jgi:hypothetical protein
MFDDNMKFLLDVLKDVRTELDEPEVAELITLKLDNKVDQAIELLERMKNHAET